MRACCAGEPGQPFLPQGVPQPGQPSRAWPVPGLHPSMPDPGDSASASCHCCCERVHQEGRQATPRSRTDDVMCLVGITGSANWRSQGLQSAPRHSSPTPAMLDPLPVQFGRQPGDAAVPPHPMHPSREGPSPRPRPGYSPQAPSEDRETSAGFCQVASPRFDQRPPSALGGMHQEVCPSPLKPVLALLLEGEEPAPRLEETFDVLLR